MFKISYKIFYLFILTIPLYADISRIFGGSVVSDDEFLKNNFVVSIGDLNDFKSLNKKDIFLSFCTGVLLSPRWVLTASHCLKHTKMVVYAKTHLLFNNTKYINTTLMKNHKDAQIVKVRRIFYHYDFELLKAYGKTLSVKNDIALLQLQEDINISTYPILATDEIIQEVMQNNKKAHLFGWGEVEKHKLTPTLRHTYVHLLDHKLCKVQYKSLKKSRDVDVVIDFNNIDDFDDNIFCAGGTLLEKANRGACFGDSGASLIYTKDNVHYLLGVLSTGNQECGILPDKYMKLSKYRDFIQNTMKYKNTKIRKLPLTKGYIEDLAEGFHMLGTEHNIDSTSDIFESIDSLWIQDNKVLKQISLIKGHLPKGVIIKAKSGFWIKK